MEIIEKEIKLLTIKKIQCLNWFPYWKGIKFKRTNPKTDTNAAYYLIYKWYILLGFWEIRKFMNDKERKDALKIYQKIKKLKP